MHKIWDAVYQKSVGKGRYLAVMHKDVSPVCIGGDFRMCIVEVMAFLYLRAGVIRRSMNVYALRNTNLSTKHAFYGFIRSAPAGMIE